MSILLAISLLCGVYAVGSEQLKEPTCTRITQVNARESVQIQYPISSKECGGDE